MNTRRGRGRQKPTDSPEVSSTTPLKKTLLTPCRRMGLGRKRNVNSPDIGKTTRLDCTPSLDDSENLVSETPSKETSATLDAGPSSSLPATPIEPVAKSSSSRRKKSSNPLKRTVDESPNVSEDDPEGYLASQEIVETPKKKTTITRTDIKDEIIQTERRIKEKEAKLERLKLIGVYKKTHDLEKLKKLTAQLKRGCQDALLELAAVLRETSYTPFDMATLLHNMHIPNDQVGYNPEVDEFL